MQSDQEQPNTTHAYDEQATEIITRWIDSTERAEDICCQIIDRAYGDAEMVAREMPELAVTCAPREDAADAIREFAEEESPFSSVDTPLFSALVGFALDRCDFGAIVDRLRQRMEQEAAAAEALDQPPRHARKDGTW